jgi:TonB family protein
MSTAVMSVSFQPRVMPWAGVLEDDTRFKRIQQRVLGVALLFCLAFPWIPVHKPERTVEALPPRIAKLVLEQHETPPAPPPKPAAAETAPKPDKAEPLKPDAAKPEKAKPAPAKGAIAPEARNPQPNKPPGEVLDGIRRKAAGVGLLAMKDQIAELRGAPLAVQLKTDIDPKGRGVGTGTGVGVGAGTQPGLPDRNMITSNAAGGSGGINTAAYSRDTGGGGLAGRATTLVEGVAGGGGGGGAGGGGVRGGHGNGAGTGVGGGKGGTLTKGGSGKASRSIEEIRLVFERNKGSIYAIYNRALREDPALQGKVVFELKIAPGGNVVDCRVVSSELKSPEMEGKLLARIRQFDFGAKDVDQMTVTYPVDFLPS